MLSILLSFVLILSRHCSFPDEAYLTHYSGETCDPGSVLNTETYYLGCNPSMLLTDSEGQVHQLSVAIACTADDNLDPLSLVPLDGETYAVQE